MAALLLLALLAGPLSCPAQENAYDVLGKALMPIARVFATDENGAPVTRALVLDARLTQASRLPPELQGAAVHVALRTPDAVLVQAPIAGQMLTVCRDGEALWATRGSAIQPLLGQLTAAPSGKKKKKHLADAARILGPLELPVPAKELVFLPVLFQVEDAGTESIAGKPCRVMNVRLMQQLTKSLHAEGWTSRVWIDADYQIAQIALKGPDWDGTVAIDRIALPATLPDATFQPQGADVLRLTAEQFVALISAAGRK